MIRPIIVRSSRGAVTAVGLRVQRGRGRHMRHRQRSVADNALTRQEQPSRRAHPQRDLLVNVDVGPLPAVTSASPNAEPFIVLMSAAATPTLVARAIGLTHKPPSGGRTSSASKSCCVGGGGSPVRPDDLMLGASSAMSRLEQ